MAAGGALFAPSVTRRLIEEFSRQQLLLGGVLETIQAIESGSRLPTKQEIVLLATGLELTAGRLAEILRPVVRHQASGIRAFG